MNSFYTERICLHYFFTHMKSFADFHREKITTQTVCCFVLQWISKMQHQVLFLFWILKYWVLVHAWPAHESCQNADKKWYFCQSVCIEVWYRHPVNIHYCSSQQWFNMVLDAWRPVFGDLRTTQAQTSLRIRAVWSAPLLFAVRKVAYVNLLQVKFQFPS